MQLLLDSDSERRITERVKSGKYSSPEAVIAAALHALEHDEKEGDFAPGEWDALIAEGDASGAPLDGLAVLDEFRAHRAAGRSGKAG